MDPHGPRHRGAPIEIVNFTPVDGDEFVVEFRTIGSATERGVDILDVFRSQSCEQLYVRVYDPPVSVDLILWAIQEARSRLFPSLGERFS